MKIKAKGFTLIELSMVIIIGGVSLLLVTAVVVLALWGTSDPNLTMSSQRASEFSTNFHNVQNVSCMEEANHAGHIPCTIIREDGTFVAIECNEGGCFITTK